MNEPHDLDRRDAYTVGTCDVMRAVIIGMMAVWALGLWISTYDLYGRRDWAGIWSNGLALLAGWAMMAVPIWLLTLFKRRTLRHYAERAAFRNPPPM